LRFFLPASREEAFHCGTYFQSEEEWQRP
jgi:hypothetical protein